MKDKDLKTSVTFVTRPTLLQRMRQKRGNTVSEIETCSVVEPLTLLEDVTNSQLPQLVINWISICLNEGHIQPSQPTVGRLEGWPIRPFFKSSLYVDFECWCLRAGVPTYLIPSKDLFYQGTNAIFESIDSDKYQFPDLTICREKFSELLKEVSHE